MNLVKKFEEFNENSKIDSMFHYINSIKYILEDESKYSIVCLRTDPGYMKIYGSKFEGSVILINILKASSNKEENIGDYYLRELEDWTKFELYENEDYIEFVERLKEECKIKNLYFKSLGEESTHDGWPFDKRHGEPQLLIVSETREPLNMGDYSHYYIRNYI